MRPRGSVSAMVVSLTTTFVLLAGLAFDGGRVVNTYVRLSDVAENTARLGAQNIDGIRAGMPHVDPVTATQEMNEFLGTFGLTGTYSFTGTSISIEVSRRIPMTILKMLGITSRRVRVARTVTVMGA